MGIPSGSEAAGRLRSDTCSADWILEREFECADAETARAMSDTALERQLAALPERSPFYRRKFRSADVDVSSVASVDDLRHLPFTTKSDLRESQRQHPPFGDYLAVDRDRVKRVYQTSGTTGAPNLIALTGHDIAEVWGRIQARSYYASGVHPHNSVLSTYGAGPFVAGSTHRVMEQLGACSVPVAPGDTPRVRSAFAAGIVDTMNGTPTFGMYLANRLESEGVKPGALGLVHFMSGGEPGGGIDHIRARIEDGLGTQVTEIYGLADITPSLFGECPAGRGLHFSGTGLVWPELIDAQTLEPIPIEGGAVGEIVYTALNREAMPLVRYRSGDQVEIQSGECPCGRTSFRMRVIGRIDDMFIVRGVNVYPSALNGIMERFRPVVTGRYRVVLGHGEVSVTPPVEVEVELPGGQRPESGLGDRIAEAVRQELIFRCAVTFLEQPEFGEPSYKTPLVRRVSRG
jgi:phenylacetate-CoA ligase